MLLRFLVAVFALAAAGDESASAACPSKDETPGPAMVQIGTAKVQKAGNARTFATIEGPGGTKDFTNISGFLIQLGQSVWDDRAPWYTYGSIGSQLAGAIPHVGHCESEPTGRRTISCSLACWVFVSYEYTHDLRDAGLPTQLADQQFENLGDEELMVAPYWMPGMRTFRKHIPRGTSVTLEFQSYFVGLIAVKEDPAPAPPPASTEATIQGPDGTGTFTNELAEGKPVWIDARNAPQHLDATEWGGVFTYKGRHLEPPGIRTISCPQECILYVAHEQLADSVYWDDLTSDNGLLPQQLADKGFANLPADIIWMDNYEFFDWEVWKKHLAAGSSVTLNYEINFCGFIGVKIVP